MIKYRARDLSIGGLFGALGVAVPVLFHMVGMGTLFLPMHLPILICGLYVSVPVAFAVGVVTPLISSALTGMPPLVPTGVLMMLELGVLAGSASLFGRRLKLPVILSVILAMTAARLVGGLERVVIAPLMGLQQGFVAYLAFSVIESWPGIALQIVVAPIVVRIIGTHIRKAA
ncbi:ECF transporter S component [bacterium]|nr:ECF transporter S component [bacterium]